MKKIKPKSQKNVYMQYPKIAIDLKKATTYIKEHERMYNKIMKSRENSTKRNMEKKIELIGRTRPEHCELHELLILPTTGNPVADHNHDTGKGRGWVCSNCNVRVLPEIDRLKKLGIEKEDIKSFLSLAVDYVFSDGDNVKLMSERLAKDPTSKP